MTSFAAERETMARLDRLAKNVDVACVLFSGGKDSWAILDMACRTFRSVIGAYMYFVPGLAVVEQQLSAARSRYGIEFVQYPHWSMIRAIKEGVYCDPPSSRIEGKIWECSIVDLFRVIKHDTGAGVLLHGAKRTDSPRRRQTIASMTDDFVVYPLYKWTKIDVITYLKMRNIDYIPPSGKTSGGIDLSSISLLWLYDNHPEDFSRLLRWFPYAMAVVKRREFYGQGKEPERAGRTGGEEKRLRKVRGDHDPS